MSIIWKTIGWILLFIIVHWAFECRDALIMMRVHPVVRGCFEILVCVLTMSVLLLGMQWFSTFRLMLALVVVLVRDMLALSWRDGVIKFLYQHGVFYGAPLIAFVWAQVDSTLKPLLVTSYSLLLFLLLYGWMWSYSTVWRPSNHAKQHPLLVGFIEVMYLVLGVLLWKTFMTIRFVFSFKIRRLVEAVGVMLALVSLTFLPLYRSFVTIRSIGDRDVLLKIVPTLLYRVQTLNCVEERFLLDSHSSKLLSRKRPLLCRSSSFFTKKSEWLKVHHQVVGIMHCDKNVLSIYIRGTNQPWEWVGNLLGAIHTFSPTDQTSKHVEMNRVAHTLVTHIQSSSLFRSSAIQSVTVVGHSRGSTLALYVALQLIRSHHRTLPIHLLLLAPPPLVTLESYNTFLLSNAHNTVTVLTLHDDLFHRLSWIHPTLTTYCPSLSSTRNRVMNIVYTGKRPTILKNEYYYHFQDPKRPFRAEHFVRQQEVHGKKAPLITHDLVQYHRFLV